MDSSSPQNLARLHLLAWMVRVDGAVQPWERTLLAQAIAASGLPDQTIEALLETPMPLSEALATITDPEIQHQAYDDALAFAQLDGMTPSERELLHTIQQAFHLEPPADEGIALTAVDWDSPELSGRGMVLGMRWLVTHSEKMRDRILDYALGAAILALIPAPLPLLRPLLLVILLFWMRRDIKRHWGAPRRKDLLALAGFSFGALGAVLLGGLAGSTLLLISLRLVALRPLALAIAYFTLIWSLGQITNQYYLSGCRLDIESLRQVADPKFRPHPSQKICKLLRRIR